MFIAAVAASSRMLLALAVVAGLARSRRSACSRSPRRQWTSPRFTVWRATSRPELRPARAQVLQVALRQRDGLVVAAEVAERLDVADPGPGGVVLQAQRARTPPRPRRSVGSARSYRPATRSAYASERSARARPSPSGSSASQRLGPRHPGVRVGLVAAARSRASSRPSARGPPRRSPSSAIRRGRCVGRGRIAVRWRWAVRRRSVLRVRAGVTHTPLYRRRGAGARCAAGRVSAYALYEQRVLDHYRNAPCGRAGVHDLSVNGTLHICNSEQ